MTDSTAIELVDETSGEPFATVHVNIIEVTSAYNSTADQRLAVGFYFAIPPLVQDLGTSSEVFLHGPYAEREEAEIEAGEFILKAAESKADDIINAIQCGDAA